MWANLYSVGAFAILFYSAIICRTSSDIDKRLILKAAISIPGPALARISRLEILGSEQGPFIPLAFFNQKQALDDLRLKAGMIYSRIFMVPLVIGLYFKNCRQIYLLE